MTHPKNWNGDYADLARYTAEVDRLDRAERLHDDRQDRKRLSAGRRGRGLRGWLDAGLTAVVAVLGLFLIVLYVAGRAGGELVALLRPAKAPSSS